MDFGMTEAQGAVAELARRVFADRCKPAALRACEAGTERFDGRLWADLAATGLLGMAIPECHGGGGNGYLELCTLMEEAGAAVAPVPLWATLVLGALPLARFGTAAQQARWLPAVAAGEALLTAALAEPANRDAMRPVTVARREGAGWSLAGVKAYVPVARRAARVLVPARLGEGGCGVFLVDPSAAGVTLVEQVTTTGEALYELVLEGVRVEAEELVGGPELAGQVLAWLVPRATVALCAMELGVAARALKMTAEYTSGRRQFERPIATFQAVSQRAADAYVDVESMRVTTWAAAWRLAEERAAGRSVAIAKYVSAEAGHRVVYAAQHLHGGIGFDRDYPLHRYYLWSKQVELTLGSASEQLYGLGLELARDDAHTDL